MGNPERSNKALKRKKTRQKIIMYVCIALLVIVAAVLFTRRNVQKKYGNRSIVKVETTQVTTGSISTTVSGSGSLTSEDIRDITVPAPVDVDTVYVKAGDSVKPGTMLASVSTNSVLSALADVQTELDNLDKQLKEASRDAIGTSILAGINGRVKAIFAAKDDDVSTVMYNHGALAILSLDGHMAVDVESSAYKAGDPVTVTASDGTEYEGTVDKVLKDTATILITDDGPLYGDKVTVDGKLTGELYVHEPLKVTGYAGKVSYVAAQVNSPVYPPTTLFNLTDTSYSANYDQLLKDRMEYEDVYQTLIKLYKDGGILAETSGIVATVKDSDSKSSSSSSASSSASSATAAAYAAYGITLPASTESTASSDKYTGTGLLDEALVLTLDPCETMSVTMSIDETDILSLAVGQEVEITVDSIGKFTYTGTVSEIDTTASGSSDTNSYTAKVLLDRAPKMLPGMTAEASITIEGVENAMLVPEDAVQRTAASAYVYTSYDEETDTLGGMVEVTVGISNGKIMEIIDGVKEGDVLYYIPKEKTFTFGNFTFTAGGNNNRPPHG